MVLKLFPSTPPWLLVLLLSVALVIFSGCSSESGFSLAGPFAATPTATSTATPIPPTSTVTSTATSTATSIPTSTATTTATSTPTSTATPTPTATPEPFLIALEFRPSQVRQGGVLMVLVRSNRPMQAVQGTLAGLPLRFKLEGQQAWGLVGFSSYAPTGPRQLLVQATAERDLSAQASTTIQVVPEDFQLEQIWLPPGQGALLEPAVIQTEWGQLLAITSVFRPERSWSGTFLAPAQGEASSEYGTRRSYNGGPASSAHEGHDIAAEAGDPVRAANAGVVVLAQEWKVRGNAVIIDHGMGVYSGYYHLSEINVTQGQRVTKGQLLGTVGESGLATGPHLHWDMILLGVHTAPLEWTQYPFLELPAQPTPAAAPG